MAIRFIQLFFLLVLCVHISHAQEYATRMIYSGSLENKDKVWQLLGQGVTGFEVDVMYIYGELYVTSSMPDSANHKHLTLSDACLFPLYSHSKKVNAEKTDATKQEILLLLNIKNDPIKAYSRLKKAILPLRDQISFRNTDWHQGSIRILTRNKILSDFLEKEELSYLGFVGNKEDLNTSLKPEILPLIEFDFAELTNWHGAGNIPFPDYVKIKELINKAHQQGRKVCISNCPNHQAARDVLTSSKVDFILTNDPENCKLTTQ